jgi:hypothetical protein
MMATQEQIDSARERLESEFARNGECKSCGWHAALYEHGVSDASIEWALDHNDGELRISCIGPYSDEGPMHRGTTIYIGEKK